LTVVLNTNKITKDLPSKEVCYHGSKIKEK
jgi:hypothetical protein